jgi:hypothetical protein
MNYRSFVVAFTVSSVLACSSSTDPFNAVTVAALANEYAPGQMVDARLFNGSNEAIGYGACALRLERRQGNAWVLVGPEMVPCIDILYILDSNASVTIQTRIDKSVPIGIYRVRATIYPRTQIPSGDISSREFIVRSAA